MEVEKGKYNYLILSIIGSLSLIIATMALFIKPLFLENVRLAEEVKVKLEEVRFEEQKLADLKVLEGEYSKIKDKVKEVDIALPQKEQLKELLSQISNISSSSGLYLKNFQPTSTARTTETNQLTSSEESYQTINLQCQFYGTFTSLKKALEAMEKNRRIIDITSLKARRVGTQEASNILDITLNLKVYWQK